MEGAAQMKFTNTKSKSINNSNWNLQVFRGEGEGPLGRAAFASTLHVSVVTLSKLLA